MERILSGIRPTGGIHLGNYLGSLKQWISLANEQNTECFFMVADYHALLSFRETPLNQASFDLLAWELAAGLDPSKVTLFMQSQIPAHSELMWILSNYTTVGELNRMTQFKDKASKGGPEGQLVGLYEYPVLMAADILLYKATTVPVGEDQVQHVELTRTLAKRFNQRTDTEIFPSPKPRLTDSARIMSLHDPLKKMSKSLPQGALLLEDDEETLRSKISRAVTDTGPEEANVPEDVMPHDTISVSERSLLFEHMSPGVRNLFVILQETSSDPSTVEVLLQNYRHQTLQYRELKAAVADAVVGFILPLQSRYKEQCSNESMLHEILIAGSAKAKEVADSTLCEVKDAFHLVK